MLPHGECNNGKDWNDELSTPTGVDIVVVCKKLITGCNFPQMYIDRTIGSDYQSVQCLSRLNRRYEGKNEVFVFLVK